MSDINKCFQCNGLHHIDEGELCGVCTEKLCSGCATEQGFWFFDIFEGAIFVCKGCIAEYKEQGMDWLRGELLEEFEEQVFLDALNKFESLA